MPTLGREWVMINNLGLEEVMNPKIENLRRRIQNSTALLKSDKWDAFIIVDDLPDAVFHHAYHDRSIVRRTFELFDEWLGVILQEFKSGDSLFVVSDHGFSEVLGKLFINEWLIEKGYLRPKKSYSFKSVKKFGRSQLDAVRRLGHSMSRTDLTIKARPKKNSSLLDVDERSIFSVGYVHDEVAWLKLREDLNADGESNIDRVIQDLEQLKQRAVVKNVFKVSEIYHGKHLSKAPGQVLLEAVDGWQISKSRHPQRRLSGKPNSMMKGTHRLEGMLNCLGVDLTESPPCLYDIVPTVLDLLRLPIPDYLDGQSLIVKNSTGSRSWSLDTKLNDHSNNSNLV